MMVYHNTRSAIGVRQDPRQACVGLLRRGVCSDQAVKGSPPALGEDVRT
ncbi:hypothetical protein C4J89_2325 [Pseudomonas sp. R4-35-07]|nr:hypothetical protein C4J91_2358 [Pseudomonas sp. R3-52-08]AZF31800.1 hypothetical protein C4J89_2325 [Pseudomonas sp. R4-35-07]